MRCSLIFPWAESYTSRDCVNLETWHLTVLFGSSIWVGFLLGDEEIAVVLAHSSQGSSLSFIIIFPICCIFNHLGDGYSDFPTNWLNVCLFRSCLTLKWVIVTQLYLTLCFVTPQTVACQAPLSMDFSREGYWIGLPFLLCNPHNNYEILPELHCESFKLGVRWWFSQSWLLAAQVSHFLPVFLPLPTTLWNLGFRKCDLTWHMWM